MSKGVSKGVARIHRPGSATVGLDLDGPTADLAFVERELLVLEDRIEREGGKIAALYVRVRDVVAILGGTTFVRFARAYIDRHATFERAAVYVERSFVVRQIIDPIALLAPRITIRTFSNAEHASGWVREVDPTFVPPNG